MKPVFIISESSHVPGKVKSYVSNVFSHAQPCPMQYVHKKSKAERIKDKEPLG